MRRILTALAILCAVASYGDVQYEQTISATQTSQTVTMQGARTSISLYNCSNGTTATCSGSSAFIRVFYCYETSAAATTADLPLASGEAVSFTYDASKNPDRFCAISIVCDSGNTASVRLIAQ